MFRIILAILLIIPFVEMWGLITAGKLIGPLPTILAVVATSVIGGYLAKQQGLQTWRLAQIQLQRGQLPSQAIIDGIFIFAGGLLLLTPGFVTDIFGFLLLVPMTRAVIRVFAMRWLERKIRSGKFNFTFRR